jgi:uncharacterized membrane protein YhaH (DUF805 family)
MLQWIVHCFRNYAVFKGRAARPEYWWFYFLFFLGHLPIQFAIRAAPVLGWSLWWLWAGLTFIPFLAVTSRRLHDTGYSLWWYAVVFLPLIPIMSVGITKPPWLKGNRAAALVAGVLVFALFGLVIRLLVLLCRKGESGPNRYGDPAPTAPS